MEDEREEMSDDESEPHIMQTPGGGDGDGSGGDESSNGDESSIESLLELDTAYDSPCLIDYKEHDPDFDENKVELLGKQERMESLVQFYNKNKKFVVLRRARIGPC